MVVVGWAQKGRQGTQPTEFIKPYLHLHIVSLHVHVGNVLVVHLGDGGLDL
jgi:hypothetical protein